MNIKQAEAFFFSPTGTTRSMLFYITSNLAIPVYKHDMTMKNDCYRDSNYTHDSLVFIATPVHEGRIPSIFLERLKHIKGDNTPAVIILSYGNRGYEDAALELQDFLEKQGFIICAAGIFVAEHSIIPKLGHKRPDRTDVRIIRNFSFRLWNKISAIDNIEDLRIQLKGSRPYRTFSMHKFHPQGNITDCYQCSVCVTQCPVGAICASTPHISDETKCISCMRCMKVCSSHSRKISKIRLFFTKRKFLKRYAKHKDSEYYL